MDEPKIEGQQRIEILPGGVSKFYAKLAADCDKAEGALLGVCRSLRTMAREFASAAREPKDSGE